MDGIADLERRISAALARLGEAVERRMDAPAGPSPAVMEQIDRLRAELDEERMTSAQLTERLRHHQDQIDRPKGDATAEIQRLTTQVDDQALAMQRLVTSTIQLREELRRVRDQLAAGGAVDAALIDKTLVAELESLRAERAAELTGLADIIAALSPVIANEEARTHA